MVDRVDRDVSVKHLLKIGRWRWRRFATAVRWGNGIQKTLPAVLGNAMPKSGSHLIIQVLQGLTKIGPFVNPGFPPVNRTEDNQQVSEESILKVLSQMMPGDIGYGYLEAKDSFIQALTRSGLVSIFVYRDPRDMVVSHVFYATEMHPGHGMHRYYTETLGSMEERINAAIEGVTEAGFELKSVRQRYENYMAWRNTPGVLCLRFEELRLDQRQAFSRILDFLGENGFHPNLPREAAISEMGEYLAPKKSGTFRKGMPGSWQEYFSLENIDVFKQNAGDLLIDLGYEENLDW